MKGGAVVKGGIGGRWQLGFLKLGMRVYIGRILEGFRDEI